MKRSSVGLFCVAAALTAMIVEGAEVRNGGPKGAEAADVAAVRAAIEEAHKSFAASEVGKDVDGMLRTWSEDIVLMPPGKEPIYGKDAVARYLEPLRTSKHRVLSERFDTVDLKVAGDTAFEVGHVVGEEQAPGKEVTRYRTKYLSVWKRQPDGTWRVCRDMWDFIPQQGPVPPQPR